MGKKKAAQASSNNGSGSSASASAHAASPVKSNGANTKLLSAATSPASSSNYSNYGALVDDVRSAHASNDGEKSRQLHQIKLEMGRHDHAMENHMAGGDHIKSAVYGGLDGIITTFATVTSVAGSGLPHSVILIIGLAHLVADGLSMGLGDMLSSQAEADLVKHERAREVWEFENYPEGEIEEMVELYEKKGISTNDAKLVVTTLAKYKEAFIDIMMVEELNLMPIDDEDSPLKGGIITFVSFMLFGVIPLLSYLVNLIPGLKMSPDTTFNASCVLTVITLFLLGAVKGSFVGQKWYQSGASMAVNGSLAAFFGWLIGYLLKLTGIQDVA